MEWTAAQENIHIQHAGNGREFKIGQFKVDGYIDSQRRVIEFLGCYYHSHPGILLYEKIQIIWV
jgi:hypothetical protein